MSTDNGTLTTTNYPCALAKNSNSGITLVNTNHGYSFNSHFIRNRYTNIHNDNRHLLLRVLVTPQKDSMILEKRGYDPFFYVFSAMMLNGQGGFQYIFHYISRTITSPS